MEENRTFLECFNGRLRSWCFFHILFTLVANVGTCKSLVSLEAPSGFPLGCSQNSEILLPLLSSSNLRLRGGSAISAPEQSSDLKRQISMSIHGRSSISPSRPTSPPPHRSRPIIIPRDVSDDSMAAQVLAIVSEVMPGSPAEEGGLREGDRVISLGNVTLDQVLHHGGRVLERAVSEGKVCSALLASFALAKQSPILTHVWRSVGARNPCGSQAS
eukprot:1057453-Rhodomonas_salina.1